MKRLMVIGVLFASLASLAAIPGVADEIRPSASPRRVLAFYYAWYGNPEVSGHWRHWEKVRPDQHDIASATHYPRAGAYDSADPQIIDQHMRQMAEAGIDGPILSWWGPKTRDSDHITDDLLKAATHHGRVVSAYYETIRGADLVASATADLAYLVSKYGAHPAWLKVGGRPVIFVYGRAVSQMGPLERWQEVRARVRRETGHDPFLIGDRIDAESAAVFDGIHTYNTVGLLAGKPIEQMRRQNRAAANLTAALAHAVGKLACVTIIPGYDDTKIRKPGLACSRQGGGTYQTGWEAAVASDCDWVVITSWNEWHEGSEIEPSYELGERDWKATRPWADRFRSDTQPPSAAPVPEVWRDYVTHWTWARSVCWTSGTRTRSRPI
jgi:glycoprotein endo-alpha-1,2-mannosidase